MSANALDTALAPIGFGDMLRAFVASARQLRATRIIPAPRTAAMALDVANAPYADRIVPAPLDFRAIRSSSFRR